MKEFKIRCSAISNIMAYKDKNQVPKGAITYLNQWVKERVFKRQKFINSKFIDKGNICEPASIEFASKILDLGILIKNEENLNNEFLTGTPDIASKSLTADIKNSWDCFTFPLLDSEIPNDDYYWQLQGYMSLTGADRSLLIYTLMDTPEDLIWKEAYRSANLMGMSDVDEETYEEVKSRLTYSDIPANLKIKVFEVLRNESDILLIQNRVKLCREWLDKNLSDEIKELIYAKRTGNS